MKKIVFCRLLLASVLLGPAAPGARAWGPIGHRVISQVAVYQLPASLQAFYYRHLPELVRQSTAPDERRAQDPDEALRHVIYLDHYAEVNPFAKIPRTYEAAAEKFTADSLKRNGTLPWAILEAKDKLVAAFRARDTTAIIQLSAELSNYCADAFVPLRTTLNYDGQLSRQTGLLSLWESQLPERFLADYKLGGEAARVLPDPVASVWLVLQNSYGFLTATYDLETKVAKGFTPKTKYSFAHHHGTTQRRYSDAFADAYEKEVGGMVMFRLQSAPPMVASLWLTAWEEAGRPDLSTLMAPAKLSKDERAQLATQLKAWKANALAQDHLLLALVKEVKADDPDDIKAAEGQAAPPPADGEPADATAADAPDEAAGKTKVKTKGATGTNKLKTKP